MGLTFDEVDTLPSFVNKYKKFLCAKTVSHIPQVEETVSNESNLSPIARRLSVENRKFLESLGLKLVKNHAEN